MVSTLKKTTGIFLLAAVLAGCAADKAKDESVITESLIHAAWDAQKNSNYPAAVEHFRKLHARLPDDMNVLLGLARNLRYVGAAKEAAGILEAQYETYAGDPGFLVELGKAKLAVGDSEAALGHLDQAKGLEPDNWDIYSTIGIAHDLMGKYGKAAKFYRQALELSKDNPAVLNNMAISAAQAGDLDSAIKTLKRAAIQSRHIPQLRQNLALFYGIKGDIHEAEALAKMDLDEESVRNNLAFYYRFREKQPSPVP